VCMASPVQTRLQNSGATEPKFTKFCISRRQVIGGVNARIHVAILHPLWNASAQNEGEVCRFSPIRAKNRLPKQRSLSNREKKVGLGVIVPSCTCTHICTYPENMAKIGPLYSKITGLQRTV